MGIKHSFESTKADSSDASVVGKTEWNADHVIDITTADVPDSADKRYCTDAQKTVIGNTSGTNSGDSATPAETTTTIGSLINGATAKATPVDADLVGFADTEASNILKKATWTNIKAFLKTYFDTLYNNLYAHPNHSGDVTSVADGAQTIANSAVTYAKIQNVSATDKVLGRATTGAGAVEEIACTAGGRSLMALALGAANLKLFVNAAGNNVEWASGFKIISATRDLEAVSGAVAYTGVGFKPTALIIFACVFYSDAWCITTMVGSGTIGLHGYTINEHQTSTKGVLYTAGGRSYRQEYTIQSFDSDGFTIDWTKIGTPTGIADLRCFTIR